MKNHDSLLNGFWKSADPGLCQGRVGAWDHRRCGTWPSGRKQRHTPSRQHLCQLHASDIYMLLPNSYTYMPQDVQDCRLPGLKPSKRFRRPPRQQLLQLHAPAICFSGGSRLPFARPQTPQTLPTLPQASKATTLTATCPQTLQTLPTLSQASKATTLTATCLCFSGGSRLPFARPQTPQTLPTLSQASKATTLTATCPTLPQASKATTLTATCPCHLFFRGFKTAVCPAPNPPNASNPPAGLQGNNSYSYMPLPSVFQGVQDCRLPALKPPKRFQRSRRPPRQQLLQLHVPAICFSGGSRLPSQAQLHAPAICFSGGSRLPFARPQTLQTLPALPQASKATTLTATCPRHLFLRGFKTAVCPPSNPPNASNVPQASKATTLTATCPCHLFFGGSRLPSQAKAHATFARPQTLQTLPHASKATTLTATTCPCHLFFRGFKTAVCPPSNPPNASNAPAGLQGNNSYSYMPLPSVFQGVQDCRRKQRHTPSRQHLCQLHAQPSTCSCRTLTPTCPCHLFFRTFKTTVCPASNPPNASAGLQGNNSYSYMPLPSVFQGAQDCRLPAFKPPKRFQPSRRPPRQQLLQHAPAICFSGGSRLPFARPQTPQTLPTLPQASKATTLTATCPCHLFFRGFKTAVCSASNPPNASNPPAGLQGNNKATTLTATCPCHLFFRGFKTAVCPPSNPPNASNPPAGLQGNNSYSYMSLPSVFQDVQDCRLPGLKPSKRFRRPPRQQLLQLHVPAICFSGGSRLPFARPQTPQTRACDSPSLMGLLLWHEPFCFLAWFPSRRVMVDVNLPKRTA